MKTTVFGIEFVGFQLLKTDISVFTHGSGEEVEFEKKLSGKRGHAYEVKILSVMSQSVLEEKKPTTAFFYADNFSSDYTSALNESISKFANSIFFTELNWATCVDDWPKLHHVRTK